MQSEQEGMRAVIQASAAGDVAGDVAGQAGGHPFLMVNPKYHDGKRASFILLPDLFYRDVLLREMHIEPESVRRDAGGRMCTVTDEQLVLTVTTDRHMVNVLLGPDAWKTSSDPEQMTLRKLFESAKSEGWAVSAAAHQAFFERLAKEHVLVAQWKYSVLTIGLTRSAGGAS